MISDNNTVKDTYCCEICGSDIIWEGAIPFQYTNWYASIKPDEVDAVAKIKLVEKSNKLHVSFICPNCGNKINLMIKNLT